MSRLQARQSPWARVRLQQRVKELEVKLQREAFNARQAEERLENSKSAFIESEQNARRLQVQNNALLAERVDLYMKMQEIESQVRAAVLWPLSVIFRALPICSSPHPLPFSLDSAAPVFCSSLTRRQIRIIWTSS